MENNKVEIHNPEYQINTYKIYWQLNENWRDESKRYPRNYYEEIKEAISATFRDKKFQSHIDWENDLFSLEGYITQRYPMHERSAKESENFPIPRYMVLHKNVGLVDSDTIKYIRNIKPEATTEEFLAPFSFFIIDEEKCFINREDLNYSLFFSLQLASVDPMKIDEFLDYQLELNFNNDIHAFVSFLDKTLVKFAKYFIDGRIPLVYKYQEQKPQSTSIVNDKNTQDNVSLRKKVFAMLFLLDELGVNNVDKIAIADFIKFVTGKELGTITANGNIYKIVKNQYSIDDKRRIEDLQFIRNEFEKLKLSEIVAKINKDIK